MSYWHKDREFTVLEITQDIFESWLRDTGKLDDWIKYCKDHKLSESKAFELYKEDVKMNAIFEKDIYEYLSKVVFGIEYLEAGFKALEEKKKIIQLIIDLNPKLNMPSEVKTLATYKG